MYRRKKRHAAAAGVRKNAPVISSGQISMRAAQRIKRDGVWVIEDLRTFKLRFYPGNWCRISKKHDCIFIRRGEGREAELAAVLMLGEFGLNWHYNKEALLEICQKMRFLWTGEKKEYVFRENVFPNEPVRIHMKNRKNYDGSHDR